MRQACRDFWKFFYFYLFFSFSAIEITKIDTGTPSPCLESFGRKISVGNVDLR